MALIGWGSCWVGSLTWVCECLHSVERADLSVGVVCAAGSHRAGPYGVASQAKW